MIELNQLADKFYLMVKKAQLHDKSIVIMKFLANFAKKLNVAEHIYIVGGAVRNFLINQPIKDLDVVIDSISLNGKDSSWFSEKLIEEFKRIDPNINITFTSNKYGVAILKIHNDFNLNGYNLKGEQIEIANARKESYGGESGKGYKPDEIKPATIHEDMIRREFTFNCLLWRLYDLVNGPEKAEVIDLIGTGKKHLKEKLLYTPIDPDITFSDDPTRMLRAIKFVSKYGFSIPDIIANSIRKNASKLKNMPWDALRKIIVDNIINSTNPRKSIKLMSFLGINDVIKEIINENPNFASALSRELINKDGVLLLDLLELNWEIKLPISFLSKEEQIRLREIIDSHNKEFVKKFISNLIKPQIPQMELIVKFNIPKEKRSMLNNLARKLLLFNPNLINNNLELIKELEKIINDIKYR